MNANDFITGNFVKADDLKADGPQIFTIADLGIVEFDSKKVPGTKEKKAELLFTDGRRLTLNLTNIKALAEAWTPDMSTWKGKDVIAYFDKDVMFGAKKIGGVRVRIPAAAGNESPS